MKLALSKEERRNIPEWCNNMMLCIDWVKPVKKDNCIECECPFVNDKPHIPLSPDAVYR